MYDPVTVFMRTLAADIQVDEAFASHCAVMARAADAENDGPFAEALARNGRLHRVKAITLRAQLAALVDEYGALHTEQP